MSIDNDLIVRKLKEKLKNRKKSTITLDELYIITSSVSKISLVDLKLTYTESFSNIINSLIEEGAISKRGKKTDGIGYNPLHLNYNNLLKEQKEVLTEDEKLFLHSLNKDIDITSYFKNIVNLRKDKEKLKILSEFISSINENTSYMGVNERSYELFGYEKELINDGNGLLTRAKVEVDNLRCFEQYTPLQCHILRNFYTKENRVILIIENLNTYNSLVTVAINTKLGEIIDMIIYGGGNKISGNFKQHIRYDIKETDYIYYFGDIDPEGLEIYKRLKKVNTSLDIKLCNGLYKLAINRAKQKGIHEIKNTNQNMPTEQEVEVLLESLEQEVARDFKNIIYNGKYIPQEAVNYEVLMKEVSTL